MLEHGVTLDADYWKPGPEWVSVEAIVTEIDRQGLVTTHQRRSLQTRVGQFIGKRAESRADGKPVKMRVERPHVFVDGKPVGKASERDQERRDLHIRALRRTMYSKRPRRCVVDRMRLRAESPAGGRSPRWRRHDDRLNVAA
jgi:hypothetical protein